MENIVFESILKDEHVAIKLGIQSNQKNPMDFVCVVDVSGSMQANAVLKNEENKEEDHGFEIIDIVIQAVRALIANLDEKDCLSIVLFSQNATLLLPLTSMDEKGKREANEKLSWITPEGSTNLLAGIKLGLDQLKNRKKCAKLGSLLVLTDGLPNVEYEAGNKASQRSFVERLEQYLARDSRVRISSLISTFGFGYSLDSGLLRKIAEIGQGSYNFIPESGLLGSVLVNHVANIRCTAIWGAKLLINCNTKVFGNKSTRENGKTVVDVGSILYGQDRYVVLKRPFFSSYLDVVVEFNHIYEHENAVGRISLPMTVQLNTPTLAHDKTSELLVQFQRMNIIMAIEQGMELMESRDNNKALKIVDLAIKEMTESEVREDPRVIGYIQDLTNQITYAFSRIDWYKKWGCHYLPSLASAHLAQQCNNFKDAGVQLYGGNMFKEYQSKAEEAFLQLPPLQRSQYSQQINTLHTLHKQQQMNAYYNQCGGCFSGGSTVLIADGTVKRLDCIRKGDLVQTPLGYVEVICVVINKFNPSIIDKARCKRLLGGLEITPYHPIRVGGEWQFPSCLNKETIQLLQPVDVGYYETMYDFVLKEVHSMIINGVECVTLGHGFQEDVVRHQYFGSNAVINDLMKLPGWEEGAVIVSWNQVVRNESNLKVVSIAA